MKQIEITSDFALKRILKDVESEDVVLTLKGHAVALLTDFSDEDLEWYVKERDPKFIASITKARKEVQQGKKIRHEDLKRQLGFE